jgi:hypothetical protein
MAIPNATIIVYDPEGNDRLLDTDATTPHIASSLLDDVYDQDTLREAMGRAVQVCLHMHVPIHQHFRHVYVPDASGHVVEDWALSDFAFYLLLLNGRAENADVAFAQAYAIHKAFCK